MLTFNPNTPESFDSWRILVGLSRSSLHFTWLLHSCGAPCIKPGTPGDAVLFVEKRPGFFPMCWRALKPCVPSKGRDSYWWNEGIFAPQTDDTYLSETRHMTTSHTRQWFPVHVLWAVNIAQLRWCATCSCTELLVCVMIHKVWRSHLGLEHKNLDLALGHLVLA